MAEVIVARDSSVEILAAMGRWVRENVRVGGLREQSSGWYAPCTSYLMRNHAACVVALRPTNGHTRKVGRAAEGPTALAPIPRVAYVVKDQG